MGYDPQTLAFSFPPYPSGGVGFKGQPKPWTVARGLYALSPWIGFDVWHVDPEKPNTGNRRDDSCGWFDRTPGDYADAVDYLLNDQSFMHDVRLCLARREAMPYPFYEGISERHMTGLRLPSGDALALTLMVAHGLELQRWWNGRRGGKGAHGAGWRRVFMRRRNVVDQACDLALNPIDNLSAVEEPEAMIRHVAAALNRHYRPWWKHPRWHVHHWKVNVNIVRNLKRMFQPCATCRKPLGFGYCPVSDGRGLHHGACAGHGGPSMEPTHAH
jgi:hypothetical protein